MSWDGPSDPVAVEGNADGPTFDLASDIAVADGPMSHLSPDVPSTDTLAIADGVDLAVADTPIIDDTVDAAPDRPGVDATGAIETGGDVGPDQPALLPLGAECAVDQDCASNACADGVCCIGPCAGCRACRQTMTGKANGTCAPVGDGLDPHEACKDETAVKPCGNVGTCDGNGACRKAGPSYFCSLPACNGDTFAPAATCDGLGGCTAGVPKVCAHGLCSTAGCMLSPCGDTNTDPKNCGTCGHDCLPGATCQAGQCNPAVVMETAADASLFGLDEKYLYFSQSAQLDAGASLRDAMRIEKNAVRGAPSTIVVGLPSNSAFIGALGGHLFWNEYVASVGLRGVSCQLADCAGTTTRPFAQDGELIQFNTALVQNVALFVNNPASGIPNLAWYAVGETTGVLRLAAYASPLAQGNGSVFWTTGDTVYWKYWPDDGVDGTPAGSLYGKSPSGDTQQPAKLASGLDFNTFILDANAQSVLLKNILSDGLYRVPLPLGLGAKPPQLLTPMRVVVATEDEKAVYWSDSSGTLYRCTPDDCDGSQTVLAIGQLLGAARLFQDATALYWCTTSPDQIMRLAK